MTTQAVTIMLAVSGVGLAAAVVACFSPGLFDWKSEALQIAKDQAGGFSLDGVRGHKLLDVWIKEGRG